MNKGFSRFLDTNGDGTGTVSATGNYSGGATNFFIQPGSNEQYEISSLILTIYDAVTFEFSDYGAASGLTNGISIQLVQNGATTDLTDQETIKNNFHVYTQFFPVQFLTLGPALDQFSIITALYDFKNHHNLKIVLNGVTNDRLQIVLNDNFSGLNDHRFHVKGYIVE